MEKETEVLASVELDTAKSSKSFVIGTMHEDNFGDMLPFVRDDNVTDINWNGKQLWIDDIKRGRYLSSVVLDSDFVDAFAVRVSDVVSHTYNKYNPKLEAETDALRITVIHSAVASMGTAISIRKTPAIKRIQYKSSLADGYFTQETASFLANAVRGKLNIAICGLPGVGKTELVKYLTSFILPADRAITIEDTQEIHYNKINPGKDCVELKVGDTFSYTDAIKTCLRFLPQWILLSEARSKEVQYLMEAISTGSKCITTLHTDDVRKIPYRVVNMLGSIESPESVERMAYDYFDVGVLIDKYQDKKTGNIHRYISQICLFTTEDEKNRCTLLFDKGKLTGEEIPESIKYYLTKGGAVDPYKFNFDDVEG